MIHKGIPRDGTITCSDSEHNQFKQCLFIQFISIGIPCIILETYSRAVCTWTGRARMAPMSEMRCSIERRADDAAILPERADGAEAECAAPTITLHTWYCQT